MLSQPVKDFATIVNDRFAQRQVSLFRERETGTERLSAIFGLQERNATFSHGSSLPDHEFAGQVNRTMVQRPATSRCG